jgi:acyl-CoA synthetase (NDP forming)/GNAT superfamily N-acetyltransferase
MTNEYPPHWEADVVLADGGTAHLRPIRPDDAYRLVALHSRLSPESIRYRYFAPHPRLSPPEVERFTHVDYDDRVALVAVLGDDLLAVGRYDRVPGTDTAEVAFVVDDAHQRRGLASVLLEHLAAIAAERDIRRFEAEVLHDNLRMARIFSDAGYQPSRSYEEDSVHFVFPIEPTTASLAVMQSREHRAEARSIGRLLAPRSVAVVGASRRLGGVGHAVLVNLLRSGFQGPVYPVHRDVSHIASVRAYPSVSDVPDDIDLAVLAVPAPAVAQLIAECARKRVRGLVVMSGGFSEEGPAGLAAERALVTTARANGMRVIGPNCLGIMNTAPAVRLNAALAETFPARGRAGFFSEAGALGLAALEALGRRSIGLSTFVSAGNRADVSGNDLLQYWEDDPATDVVLLHLESFGNGRKFARLARRLGRRKPIVVVKSRAALAPWLAGSADPERAVDALFRQAGVIRVDTLDQLLDVAQLLTTQPLPPGRRVAVVGNSTAPGRLAADACAGNGLEVGPLSPATHESLRTALGPDAVIGNPLVLPLGSGAVELHRGLTALLADPDVDAVVTVFVPPLRAHEPEIAAVVAGAARDSTKPLISTFLGVGDAAATAGGVAAFPSPEVAMAALGRTAAYAEWRHRPEGTVPAFADIDEDGARKLVEDAPAHIPARRRPACRAGEPAARGVWRAGLASGRRHVTGRRGGGGRQTRLPGRAEGNRGTIPPPAGAGYRTPGHRRRRRDAGGVPDDDEPPRRVGGACRPGDGATRRRHRDPYRRRPVLRRAGVVRGGWGRHRTARRPRVPGAPPDRPRRGGAGALGTGRPAAVRLPGQRTSRRRGARNAAAAGHPPR